MNKTLLTNTKVKKLLLGWPRGTLKLPSTSFLVFFIYFILLAPDILLLRHEKPF